MKLHIGCGERYLPGYKHIDVIKGPHIDYVGDIRDLSFLEDGCAEAVYACHVLEHIGRHEICGALLGLNRVIAGGGELRIAVPNFEAIVAEYQESGDLDRVIGPLYGGQNYEYNYHYQTYDFNRIKRLLEAAGFTEVRCYDWREFLPPDYDDYSRAYLPHMDFSNGRLMSLNIVAAKK